MARHCRFANIALATAALLTTGSTPGTHAIAFTEAEIYILGPSPTSIFAVDIDGDARVDIVSASPDDNTVAWHSNDNGDGSVWGYTAITTAAAGANSVHAADIDARVLNRAQNSSPRAKALGT